MSSKECEEQLNSLIEAWQLDEADLNTTDIYAIKHLLLKNQMQHDEMKRLKAEKYSNEERLKHLLKSEVICLFDEVVQNTKEYKYDISKFDNIFSIILCARRNGKQDIVMKYLELEKHTIDVEKLQSVIEEVREYVNKNCDFNGTAIFSKFVSGKKILQILDKI